MKNTRLAALTLLLAFTLGMANEGKLTSHFFSPFVGSEQESTQIHFEKKSKLATSRSSEIIERSKTGGLNPAPDASEIKQFSSG